MLAEFEPGVPTAAAEPKTIILANLQFAAPVTVEPDIDKWGELYSMDDPDWRRCGWDKGWTGTGVEVFRRKIIASKEFGPITVVFCRGPDRFTVTASFDRQVVHAHRPREKAEFYGDVVQGVFHHLTKTTGYGFGLIRQTSEEEWVEPYPEMEWFSGGPLVVRAADGTEYRIDKSRGPPEGQTKGPRGAEAMEGIIAMREVAMDVRKMANRLDGQTLVLVQVEAALRSLAEAQTKAAEAQVKAAEAQAQMGETIKAAFTPPAPSKNGDDRRGYG